MKALLTLLAILLTLSAYSQVPVKINPPIFDTIPGILVYIDSATNVKSDSCLRIMRADSYCPSGCPDKFSGCLVFHVSPCWEELRLELYTGEIIDPRRKISFH